MRTIIQFVLVAGLALAACAAPEPAAFDVTIHQVPKVVYAATQGAYYDPADSPKGAHAYTQNLTWLFHLVLQSNESEPLRVERVNAEFQRGGESVWEETFPRSYMERTEWIEGEFDDTTKYFMDNIEFQEHRMASLERPTGPELPPGEPVSWVRIPFGRPWHAEVDSVQMTFWLKSESGREGIARHTVPIVNYRQKVKLRLPFETTWSISAGNDLITGHRRTGINSLTMYGWDITKLGPNGLPYKTDGKTPADYWCYDEPVYAAGDGVAVHVRNDIAEYGIGVTPPRELLENDSDVFSGNLVVLDHGNGEYSLTCHMQAGTVPIKVGDEVKAGQLIGRAGNSGVSQIPHIHFNLMDGEPWLEAKGIPALFTDFERVRMAGEPLAFELGNPMSGWLVRPLK